MPGDAPLAVLDRASVTYPDALPGGRTVVESFIPRGVEESVLVPDAEHPSYRVQVTLPVGVSDRR